jgi:Regulated-SNARE-like domain
MRKRGSCFTCWSQTASHSYVWQTRCARSAEAFAPACDLIRCSRRWSAGMLSLRHSLPSAATVGYCSNSILCCPQPLGRRIPYAFLEDVRQRFTDEHGSDAHSAEAFSLNDAFSPVLAQRMVSADVACRLCTQSWTGSGQSVSTPMRVQGGSYERVCVPHRRTFSHTTPARMPSTAHGTRSPM